MQVAYGDLSNRAETSRLNGAVPYEPYLKIGAPQGVVKDTPIVAQPPIPDMFFLPKLISLSQDVSSMVNQYSNAKELNDAVKERLAMTMDDPRVYINVNIYVNNAQIQTSCSSNEDNKSTIGSKIDTSPLEEAPKLILTPDKKSPLQIRDLPNKLQLPQAISLTIKDQTVCRQSQEDATPAIVLKPISNKIKKRKSCNCVKKRSLEDLIRQERLFNKQVEKTKYFWRGTNLNHPFTFKKKMMDYYTETDEVMITEEVDFSKKAITADDLSNGL